MISKLASSFIDVGKHYSGRAYKVAKITPHHMAGVMDAASCARMHRDSGVQASANYYIGDDGGIVCGVDESNAAWTSADWDNDNRAITIEVSNSSTGGEWPVSQAAWDSLVALCVDICSRYGIRLAYDGTPSGTLTEHQMFAATGCPGPYMHARMGELARQVNSRLETGDIEMNDETISKLAKAIAAEQAAYAFGDDAKAIWSETGKRGGKKAVRNNYNVVRMLIAGVNAIISRLDRIIDKLGA